MATSQTSGRTFACLHNDCEGSVSDLEHVMQPNNALMTQGLQNVDLADSSAHILFLPTPLRYFVIQAVNLQSNLSTSLYVIRPENLYGHHVTGAERTIDVRTVVTGQGQQTAAL